ncbi:hypothetical protein ACHAWF_009268 [Thalassiosira exigua]
MDNIISYDTFQGFSPEFEGYPHGIVHIFIGKNMATMYSPDDPLFFPHHTNIDRVWAIWQDYWNQTNVDPNGPNFTSPEYFDAVGAYEGQSVFAVDMKMPYYESEDALESMPFFNLPNGKTPTLRDMHQSRGGTVDVQYVNDGMKRKLMEAMGYVGNPEWVDPASDPVVSIDCSGGTDAVQPDASPTMTVPDGVPELVDQKDLKLWIELKDQGFTIKQILDRIVKMDCEGVPALPEEWAMKNGLFRNPDALQCDPNDPSVPPGPTPPGPTPSASRSRARTGKASKQGEPAGDKDVEQEVNDPFN